MIEVYPYPRPRLEQTPLNRQQRDELRGEMRSHADVQHFERIVARTETSIAVFEEKIRAFPYNNVSWRGAKERALRDEAYELRSLAWSSNMRMARQVRARSQSR